MITRKNSLRSSSGFTMIEMLVTIAIAAILLAIAAPSFSTFLLNNRQSALSDAFVNGLNFARSYALNKNVPTMICPIGASGSTTCGTTWSSGWIVVASPATTPTLIQSYQTGPHDPILSPIAANAGITFQTSGTLMTTGFQFKICDSRGAGSAGSVQVGRTGFVEKGTTAGQAIWGGALTCP